MKCLAQDRTPASGRAGITKQVAKPQGLCRITTPGGLGTATTFGNSSLFF